MAREQADRCGVSIETVFREEFQSKEFLANSPRNLLTIPGYDLSLRQRVASLAAAKRAYAARGSGGGVAAEEPSRAPPESPRARIPMRPRQGRLDFGG